MKIIVNHKAVEANANETVLDVLNREGIKVPTLCHLKNMLPTGACRMCVVEDTASGRLITSCSTPVFDGLSVLTHSQRVVSSRKTIVELLLSNHPDDCLYCVRNKNCELQNLSEELNVTERRITGKKNKLPIDRSGSSLVRDPEKCILCGRCVRVCEEVMGVACIDFIKRGSHAMVATAFNRGINLSSCINCGQCIMVCPTGALTEKQSFPEILNALRNPKKKVAIQYAPSISVSIAEEFGMEPGKDINGIMNAALRKIGFDFVFDTTFGADLTIMEESAELIHRIQTGGVLPMITSCCPGWIKYAEQFAPDFIGNLSSCKSPQQMTGAILKTHFAESAYLQTEDVYSVSIMPCTAKKFEGDRKELTRNGISDVDSVLTTRELVKLINLYGVNMHALKPEPADNPLGTRTSAGKLFGASGGVMEAAIRTAYFKITGTEMSDLKIPQLRDMKGRKEARIKIGELEVGVAVVNGLVNARALLNEIREGRSDIQFIEVMACPGGCVGGGGQPIKMSEEAIKARMMSLYKIDENETVKVSHKNPDIQKLYADFLSEPLGHKSHELLHTHFQKRDVIL